MIIPDIAEYEDTDSELAIYTITNLHKEIEKLTAESTEWGSKFYNEAKKVDKAIEHIENNSKFVLKKDVGHFAIFYREMEDVTDLLEILEGEDK